MSGKSTYQQPKVYTYPGAIVRVFAPDIAEEEISKRMQRKENAAADLLKETMKGRG